MGVQTAEGEQKPSVNITWYGRKAQVWTSAVQCTPVPMYFNVIYLVWVVLVVFFYYYFCSEGVKATKMLMSSVCSSKKCCLIDRATPGTKAVTVQHISTTWNASYRHSYPTYSQSLYSLNQNSSMYEHLYSLNVKWVHILPLPIFLLLPKYHTPYMKLKYRMLQIKCTNFPLISPIMCRMASLKEKIHQTLCQGEKPNKIFGSQGFKALFKAFLELNVLSSEYTTAFLCYRY